MSLKIVLDAIDWQPLQSKQDPGASGPVDIIASHLRQSIGSCFSDCWQRVRAIDLMLDEVAAFNGVDPIRESKREVFNSTKDKPVNLSRELVFLDVDIQSPEPGEEFVTLIRKMVRAS